ncbi:hypothetical protein AMS68_008037 [Peltaster fructicola]|uniref:Uncharacterized protein n=1 Tax=Peltaster fructicola TaxID=286661 RepID=A0A6H0Y7D7_9PEZI|nr:hypothetical protein AMS68_008037 [Peltaster fructicola]
MQQPVLVRSYTGQRATASKSRGSITPTLPPISAYAFADIVRSADGPDFQSAIDGIAEICAKNRLSLAEEYASHLPPVGEITEAFSQRVGPQLRKPGLRRALTSVPEGSSGSSEGSHRSKRRSIFAFRNHQEDRIITPRRIRIGGMGRTVPVAGTTAIASDLEDASAAASAVQSSGLVRPVPRRSSSAAAVSLRQLLGVAAQAPD